MKLYQRARIVRACVALVVVTALGVAPAALVTAQETPSTSVPTPAPVARSSAPDDELKLDEVDIEVRRALSLKDALEMAIQGNPDVRLAKIRQEQAELLQSRALSLIIPRASVQGIYTIYDQELTTSFGPMEVIIRPQTEFRLNGSIRSTFDGRIFPLIDNAELTEEVSKLGSEHTSREVQHAVTATYFQLLTFQRLEDIARTSLASRRTVLQAARDRLAAEVGTAFDVTRAEVEVIKAHKELQTIRLGFLRGREMLAALLETSSDFSVSEPPTLQAPDAPDALLKQALDMRPDLRAQRKNLEVARNDIDIVWWTYAPVISAVLNGMQQPTTAFQPVGFTWNLQFIASWTLYDGGLREADLADKRAQVRQREIEVERLERSITSDLRQAWNRLRENDLQLQATEQEVKVAQKALSQAQDGYRLGVVRQLDVLDAEAVLRLAQSQLAREQLSRELVLYELYRLVGRDHPSQPRK